MFEPESKKPWKFIKPFFENHKYRCQGALLTWFQKSEKMDFTWYLFKERSYDLKNVRKKNLWSFRIFTWNIFLFEQKLTKILTTRIVSFFFLFSTTQYLWGFGHGTHIVLQQNSSFATRKRVFTSKSSFTHTKCFSKAGFEL